jgi:hypothetical protein
MAKRLLEQQSVVMELEEKIRQLTKQILVSSTVSKNNNERDKRRISMSKGEELDTEDKSSPSPPASPRKRLTL